VYQIVLQKKTKSTFSVPKDEYRFKVWEENLGIPLKTKSRVCEMHFKSQDILNEWVSGQGLISVGSEFNNINETLIGFHQLSKFKENYLRSIEKQLVLTKGEQNLYSYFFCSIEYYSYDFV